MADQLNNWVDTCNRFVAFLDIMGFKDRVFRNTHKSVLKTMESFQPYIDMVVKESKHALKATDEANSLKVPIVRSVFFSDSIILISSDDSLSAANTLFTSVEWIWKTAMLHKMPIKGAIAYGEQTANFDKSLHFGKPLIDAYELQDELLMYGVALHHTMEKYLTSEGMMVSFENRQLNRYQIPLRNSKVFHYVVAGREDYFFISHNAESVVSKLYDTVSGTPRRYVDNTLEFIQWLTEIKRKVS